jgi:thiosulfate reductase cytochrome b subunit
MLLILFAFAIFWHLITGEWKQYIPTTKKLKDQIQYYIKGIFKGAPHPTKKTTLSKLNPLQILTYLGFKVFLVPLIVISGVMYMFYKTIDKNDVVIISGFELKTIAILHTVTAFLLLAFLIVHVYMTTTGHTPTSNIKAMITGYEDFEDDDEHQNVETKKENNKEIINTENI